MGSTRLPDKVLLDVAGQPMLARVVARVQRATTLDAVVVATSTHAQDDAIANWCAKAGVLCERGSEQDVLDRYYQAAHAAGADVVVRITADCPLHDPAVIDRVVERFHAGGYDYVTNTMPYTYPDGLDVEVFSMAALERAWREAAKQVEREHVTPYIRVSGLFRTGNVEYDRDLSPFNFRWTVDEPADLEFARLVYAELADRPDFGLEDVLALIERSPQVRASEGRSIRNEGYYKTLLDQATAGAAPPLRLARSQEWRARARAVIPGGTQTFSKGEAQYVRGVSPVLLERGEGHRVWDVDGNEYIDYVQGLLPNILGYAHPEVNAAVAAQMTRGQCFSLAHPLEVELAERLVRIIPCAEMARFAKNGSDATSAAVRAARAFTRRERIACCGYHGWHDWFIGTTVRNLGVPAAVRALTHPFPYNDLDGLEAVLAAHDGQFAAVIMEPVSFWEPRPGYLEGVKQLAARHGALLIFDEMCTGFHFGLGGAQKRFGVTPDLATFGKAMGNGFPISCVVGRADVMAVFEHVFVSFTFAGDAAAMAAAMTVLDVLERTDALKAIEVNGTRLQEGVNALAKHAGLQGRLQCVGWPWWSLLTFKDERGAESLQLRSLFQQEAIKRGLLLLVTHNMTSAHTGSVVEQTLERYAAVFKTLAQWLREPDPSRFLEGPMIEPVFRVRA